MSTTSKAAETLKSAKVAKADPKSVVDIGLDEDFLTFDPTDVAPYFAQHGEEPDPSMRYRWINSDRRIIDRRISKGWVPVSVGGKSISRGDTLLAAMPKTRADKMRAQIEERARMRREAPFARYDREAGKFTKDGRLQVTE